MATFPLLYGEASTGKIKQWSIAVVDEDGSGRSGRSGVIVIEHGYEGGKLQTLQKVIREGKNVGKKNETTPLQQAIQEARAQWLKKKESGYQPRGVEDDGGSRGSGDEKVVEGRGKGQDAAVPSVMLAHDYHKRGHSIQFPCYVQPKLDGTRCVAVPGRGLFSRNKKAYPHLEHIRAEIDRLPASFVLDGELYSDTLTFQEIVGLVKAETLKPGDEERQQAIKLYVYDIVCDKPYKERWMNLAFLFRKRRFEHLVLVETERCAAREDVAAKHAEYCAAGWEGLMLRNAEGAYRGVRSADLQKYKEFLDGEYRVVGFEEGAGLEAGCVIWVCETARGQRFSCRPRGSREERAALFAEGAAHVGKMLTVRYQEETDDGLPRFPVGVGWRDWE
jgi:hypothetical protein